MYSVRREIKNDMTWSHMEEGSMNFRKMLECMAAYAKSDRAPELREAVRRLVDDEVARRKRTAARLRWHRRHASDHDPLFVYELDDRRDAVRAVEK